MEKFTLINSRRAQAWSFDVIIGISIFIVALIIFYVYAVNFSNNSQSIKNELEGDMILISSNLLSEGLPINWTSTNVDVPGIAQRNRINQTKLESFYALNVDYTRTKRLLNTRFDFYFFLSNSTFIISGSPKDGIGKPGINRTNLFTIEDPKNMLKSSRYVSYNGQPSVLNIYLWEK